MTIPIEITIALGAAVLLGLFMFGVSFVLGLVLVFISIWQKIRPDTTNFATNEFVASVDQRSNTRFSDNRAEIIANRTSSEKNFNEVLGEVRIISSQVNALEKSVAVIAAKMPNSRK